MYLNLLALVTATYEPPGYNSTSFLSPVTSFSSDTLNVRLRSSTSPSYVFKNTSYLNSSGSNDFKSFNEFCFPINFLKKKSANLGSNVILSYIAFPKILPKNL